MLLAFVVLQCARLGYPYTANLPLHLQNSRRSINTPLYPPESNALTTGKPVTASATCGNNPSSERGCNSTCPHGVHNVESETTTFAEGSIKPYSLQGQPECKEPTTTPSSARLNADAHPPQLATDGDSTTVWQSPAGMPRVTFAVDVGSLHEAWLFQMVFKGPAPRVAVLSQSNDGADSKDSWTPLQYYAYSCEKVFDRAAGPATTNDGVGCTLTSGANSELRFGRSVAAAVAMPGRFFRLEMQDYYVPPQYDSFGTEFEAHSYYRLAEFSVSGRCACNGHSSSCEGTNPWPAAQCACEHSTTGTTCDQCMPLFHRSDSNSGDDLGFEEGLCEACECNGLAAACNTDGDCLDCANNTAGDSCEHCAAGFYTPATPAATTNPDEDDDIDGTAETEAEAEDEAACRMQDIEQACGKSLADCKADLGCSAIFANVQNEGYDLTAADMQDGFFAVFFECYTKVCNAVNGDGSDGNNDDGGDDSSAEGENVAVCLSCSCNVFGTASNRGDGGGGVQACNRDGGNCTCVGKVGGRACDQCPAGTFGPLARSAAVEAGAEDDGSVCAPCTCADGQACDAQTGTCTWSCDDAHTGKGCVACAVGWYTVNQGNITSGAPAICRQCDAECDDTLGCNAAGSTVSACNSNCENMRNSTHCIAGCLTGSFQDASPLMDSAGTCHPCHNECVETCSSKGASEVACDYSCKNKIFEGTCVPQCPSRSYDAGGQYCGTCHAECAGGCVGPTEFDCDTAGCKHVVDDGGCNSACRTGDFAHRMSVTSESGKVVFVCRRCHENCDRNAGCHGPSDADCNLCSDDSFVKAVGQVPGLQCVDECDVGSYSARDNIRGGDDGTMAAIENVCFPCNVQCKGGCNGPSAHNCTSGCNNANFDGACLEACPPSTYSTTATPSDGDDDATALLTCHACNDQCKECDGAGADNCLQCADTSFDTSFASPNGQCTIDCGAGMYGAFGRCIACDSECKGGCVSSGNRGGACTDCKHYTLGNGCYSECPHMTITSSDNKTCIPCHASCAGGCDGAADTDCAQCLSVTVDGRCLAGCPEGSFRVASKIPGQADTCAACSGHCDAAYGCHGPRPSDCVVCRADTIFHNGACVNACPHDHYADVSTNGGKSSCQPCNTVCSDDLDDTASGAMCSGPSANECTKCGGHQDKGGNCVADCSALYWAAATTTTADAGSSKQCTQCHAECADGCRGAGAEACTSCKNFDHSGKCVNECPPLMYGDTEQRACVACSGLCAIGCFGPDPEHCVGDGSMEPVCSRNALTTEHGLCASSCNPLTEYKQSRRCLLCDSECATTSGCTGHGPGNCGACANLELAGKCISTCPQGWHAPVTKEVSNVTTTAADTDGDDSVVENYSCQRCDPLCAASGCTGPGVEGCLACRFINSNGTCTSSCADDHYQDAKGCRKCNSECANGCVGPLASDCMGCKNWRDQQGVCSSGCNLDATFADLSQKQCHECHPQCLATPGSGGCPTGSRADQCAVCRKFSDNGICKKTCSPNQYPRREPNDLARALSGSCVSCHPLCGQNGCVGPNSNDCVADGCQALSIVEPDAPSGFRCVEDGCPEGTYEDAASRICRSCHEECLYGCSDGGSAGDCTAQIVGSVDSSSTGSSLMLTATSFGCRNVAQPFLSGNGSLCMATCMPKTYRTESGICEACNPICGESGCTGHPDRCGVRPEQQCSKDSDYFEVETSTCRPCNPQCSSPAGGGPSCRGGGADMCVECAYAHLGEVCVDTCDTASTSQAHYYFEPVMAYCRECHKECAGGCSGPLVTDCNECRNYKLAESDACVSNCEDGEEYSAVVSNKLSNGAIVDVAVCYPCKPLLGPGPSECSACGLVTAANGKCKSACESPETPGEDGVCTCPTDAGAFVDVNRGCKSCNVQCKSTVGCTGFKPTDCNADPSTGEHGCKHVQLRSSSSSSSSGSSDGRCAPACPAMEQPNPNTNVCECDLTVSFLAEESDKCVACHGECTQGCSGPTDADCLNSPGNGCLHVYFPSTVGVVNAAAAAEDDTNATGGAAAVGEFVTPTATVFAPAGAGGSDRLVGRCVATCDHAAGFAPVGPDRVCACTDGHFEDANGTCVRCNVACKTGCTGPLETSCTACAAFLVDGACTRQCPAGYVGDYAARTCGQCHLECGINGCSAPNDANMCIRKLGYSTCANVMDDGGCAAACPDERPYMIRATVYNPNDVHTGTVLTCTEWCPPEEPYFNDPRNATDVVDNLNVTQIRSNGTVSNIVDYDECRAWEYEDGIQQRCGGYASYSALVAAHSDGGALKSSQWYSVPALGRMCGASCAAIADGLVQNKAFPNELRCSLAAVAKVETTVSSMLLDANDRSAMLEAKDIYIIAMACAATLLLFSIYYVVKHKGARHSSNQKAMIVVGSPAPPVQHVAMLGPGMPQTPRDITMSPSYVNPYSAYKNIQTPAALRVHPHQQQHPYGRPGASMVDSPSYVNPYNNYRNVQTPMAMSQLRTGGNGGGAARPPQRQMGQIPPQLVLDGGVSHVPQQPKSTTSSEL